MKKKKKVLESRKQIYWKIRKRVLESPGFSVNFFCGSHVCGLGFLSSIYGFRISSIIHGMFCKACSEVEVPILTDNGWRNFVCDCRNLFVLLASFLTFFLSSEFVPNIRECLDMNPMSVRLYSFYDDITVFCLTELFWDYSADFGWMYVWWPSCYIQLKVLCSSYIITTELGKTLGQWSSGDELIKCWLWAAVLFELYCRY